MLLRRIMIYAVCKCSCLGTCIICINALTVFPQVLTLKFRSGTALAYFKIYNLALVINHKKQIYDSRFLLKCQFQHYEIKVAP